MAPRQHLMTFPEFEWWIRFCSVDVHVAPYQNLACACGDVNCHGWRLARAERP